MASLLPQTATLTARAWLIGNIFRQLFTHAVRLGFAVAAFHIMDHPLERMITHHHIAAIVHVAKLNLGMPTAVQNHFLSLRRQCFKGFFQIKMVMLCDRFQHLEIVETAFIPTADCTARQAQLRIGHHFLRIEILLHP